MTSCQQADPNRLTFVYMRLFWSAIYAESLIIEFDNIFRAVLRRSPRLRYLLNRPRKLSLR